MKAADKGVMDEINITPLTDIFLVLLIIMMVVAPMLQFQGLLSNLGSAAVSSGQGEEDAFSVYILPDDRFKVNESDAAMEDVLRQIQDESQKKREKIYVFVDEETALENVAQVLAAAQSGNLQVVIKSLKK